MSSRRQTLIDWIEQDSVASANVNDALSVAGVYPSGASWLRFLDGLLLWLGALLLAAGVIFFFAYNWNDLGRMVKFGLVEALIVAALIVIWRTGLESLAGKVTLLVTSLFVGALLALVGQTYQTGADTFELFAAWAVLILPWVLVGRLAALWLVWLGLLHAAAIFYYTVFGGLFGVLFAPDQLLWALFVLNVIPLVIWEMLARSSVHDRWAIRILATASGGLVTALAIYAIFENHGQHGLGLLAWAVFFVGVYVVYRHMALDVFVLAGGVLSVIVVVTALLGHLLLTRDDAGAMFFIGLVVIGLSAAGGLWLKNVVSGAKA